MATSAPTRSTAKPIAVASTAQCCACGCGGQQGCVHCELTSFERPDYHCGHLLTDADLSLQVGYVVEKNKLRNRTLHGRGVVCGFKMTCDPDCCDHILVHEGYAIDACGNDIVVCETVCFDVLGALKAQHLIAPTEQRDPCQRQSEETPCDVPQCFYVSIRYQETPSDYQTPFQATCASGPQDCVPTRIKEGYKLEVSDVPPEETSFLTEFEARLKRCFRLFIDSPVGRLIAKYIDQLQAIVGGDATTPGGQGGIGDCELFCLLKVQFQHFMRQYPDMLGCHLAKEVAALECPNDVGQEQVKTLFASLFEAMSRYQYDCVMASLVFSCEAPKEGGAVLLGCVEVDDCCVLRINNGHRRYVWSFANILQVLMATVMNARPAPSKFEIEGRGTFTRAANCCDDGFDFDQRAFLDEFSASPAGRFYAAMAPARAFAAIRKSLGESFAFTDSNAIAPELFTRLDAKQAMKLARSFGIGAEMGAVADEPASLNPFDAMLSQAMLRRDATVRLYPDGEDRLRAVVPDAVASDGGVAEATIAELKASLRTLQARVDKLEPAPAQPGGTVATGSGSGTGTGAGGAGTAGHPQPGPAPVTGKTAPKPKTSGPK